MSTLPTPLLSLLRKFFLEISTWRPDGAQTRSRLTGIFTSLLRAAAIPSLGYLFDWKTRFRADSAALKVSNEYTGHEPSGSEKDEGDVGRKGAIHGSSQEPKPPRKDKYDKKREKEILYDPNSPIYRLMNNPALFEPTRKPRYPIVLAHGLYGYDVRGEVHYWNEVLQVLRSKVGAKVIVTRAPSTGSIQERAKMIHEMLKVNARGQDLNFMGHSMGGLDCRYLISNLKPTDYTPRTVTTICTPHRGSPFMDWLKEHIGLGSIREPIPGISSASPSIPLPSSLVEYFDSPAYSNLTSSYLNTHFNPSTPDSPDVRYWSVAARTPGLSPFHSLWLPKLIIDLGQKITKEEIQSLSGQGTGNDGIVPVESAKWGEFLGVVENCDHWDTRGESGVPMDEMFKGETKWSLSDWQQFFGAWNRGKDQEKMKKKLPESRKDDVDMSQLGTPFKESATKEQILKGKGTVGASPESSSFDSILDWVVENVPGVNVAKAPLKIVGVLGGGEKNAVSEKEKALEKEKAPQFDLARFYAALCRKLYDEGY